MVDASPPPPWNFAVLPQVEGDDAYWAMKQARRDAETPRAMPRLRADRHAAETAPIGFVIAFFAVVMGFALIWHIWWLAIVGLIGIIGAALVHAWRVRRRGRDHRPRPSMAAAGGPAERAA